MQAFWYPYRDAGDALRHLAPFADASVGNGCGISYSDGRSVAVVRRPAGRQNLWLNVLRSLVAAPKAPAKSASHAPSAWERVERFFERAMTAYGESELRNAEATMAASQALGAMVDRGMWQPTHEWLQKHKLIADGLGVAVDVVGVVAGVAFAVAIAPELGVVAIVAGLSAFAGSAILLGVDGAVLGLELAGREESAKAIEDSHTAQWARIVGTIMTLPDMAVGGVRAIKEIGTLANEGREAAAASRAAVDAAEAQRLRAAKIHNPAKHPGPVQKHLHKARAFAAEAKKQAQLAQHAAGRARLVAARDVGASYVATPLGAALISAAPPGIALSEAQKRRDERLLQQLAPDGGMPRDVKLQMRASSISKPGK